MSNTLMGFAVVTALALGMAVIAVVAGLMGLSHGSKISSGPRAHT